MSTEDEIKRVNEKAQKDRDAAETARAELAKKMQRKQEEDLVKAKEAAETARKDREKAEHDARS